MRVRRVLIAAVFLILPALVGAQDQAKPAASPTPSPAQQQAQPESTNKELVEASKGAEQGKEKEEGDEEAQFKYSPSVQWIARHTGLSTEGAYWVCIAINFVVVAGFIAWGWKKLVPGMFRDRTALIKKALEEARAASTEANRRLSDIEGRLAKLDSEIAGMRSEAERAAAEEEQRLKAAAEEDKQRIVTSAEQEIASAAKMARGELKKFAAELAVGLAEKKVQVTPDADASLVRNFTGELGNERRSS